ncbi:hypothetical protein LMG24235_04460 [Paraburkholderia sabiae]|nr:hypothetical protein LMG24235_04460 [Paraburkholderia sabiae]
MKRLLLPLAMLLAVGFACLSTRAQAPGTPPQVTSQVPAASDAGDPGKRNAIDRVLAAIDARKLAGAIADNARKQAQQLVPAILSDALTENTTLTEAQKQAAVPGLQKNAIPALVNSAGQIFRSVEFQNDAIALQASAYDRHYTAAELDDLTTFYQSPTGRRFIEVQDAVGRDVVNSLTRVYMPKAIRATRAQADAFVAEVAPPPPASDTSPCAGRVGCFAATLRDPFTPPQSKTGCLAMDWDLSWCHHSGCPRNCTQHGTQWRHMENTFVAYMDVPSDWDARLRARVEGAARQCWAEGYQAAGYATLEAIILAVATQGASASSIPAHVVAQTQVAITNCLQREGQQLGIDLQNELTPKVEQASGGWTGWQ